MGFFDIFKKRTNDTQLEVLLKKAATDPASRFDFYKSLLSQQLIVITDGNSSPNEEKILTTGTSVNIVGLSDGRLPVFTSKERIFDKGVIKNQVHYMEMKGEDLFTFTKGATFVLNPYSDYGKELLPDEIESMLNGDIFNDGERRITIQKDTQVQIGQPSVYPTEMINALKRVFAGEPNVKAAYLGWIYNPESGEPPHYIFGVDSTDDSKSIHNKAGFTAQQYLKKGEIIDFIKIDTSGVSDYLTSTTPFYKK